MACLRAFDSTKVISTLGIAETGCASQPVFWVTQKECRRHRTGPDSDEIPRRRCTGLVRDNQTDLDCGTGRPGERSRAVTHGSLARNSQHVWISVSRDLSFSLCRY